MSATTAAERAGIREMAQQLASCQLQARAARLDAGDDQALAECWQTIADTGLDRALLAEHRGGASLQIEDLLDVLSQLAVGDAGVAMCALLSNAALAMLDDEQLDRVGEGERWALALVGLDAKLAWCEGRLDGELGFALGAHGADGLVLLRPGVEPAVWALAADSPGVRMEREQTQMGLRGAPAASVALDGVKTLSGPGARDAAGALALVRAGTAAIAQGIAARAHELALDYARDRRQGGVAIVEHDAVSDMLAAMAVRLECWPSGGLWPSAGRWPSAAEWPDGAGPLSAARALAAKVAATDAAMATATDAVQVFGGTGYMVETGIEKLMRDARYCQLFPEPNWVAQDELMRRGA